jgi:hypothetical protein
VIQKALDGAAPVKTAAKPGRSLDKPASLLSYATTSDKTLSIVMTPGSARANIRIEAGDSTQGTVFTKTAATRQAVKMKRAQLRLDTLAASATLQINTELPLDLVVQVPPHYNVTLQRARGDVEVSGLTGVFTGHVTTGSFIIMQSSGAASVRVDSGDVAGMWSDLSGYIRTANGMAFSTGVTGTLEVGVEQDAFSLMKSRRAARAGEIQVTGTQYFVRDAAMRIDHPGELIVWEPLPNGGWLTSQNHIGVLKSVGPLYMSTNVGGIDVQSTSGNTYAFATRGDIDIAFAPTSPTSDVVIETKRGGVELTLPAGMGATFDLETSYETSDKPVVIQGPAALQHAIDSEWKSVGGAQAKTVRATGRIGDGRAKIHVRARSGDIIIRQR